MTRLRPAITLEDYERDSVSGFGDKEARAERRAARRERRESRREDRKERKGERRVERVQRKRAKVREKLARTSAPVQPMRVPTLQPIPMAMPPSMAMPPPTWQPGQVVDPTVPWVDDFVDEGDDPDALNEEATEGMGAAWSPFRRSGATAEAWGPAVRMGRKLRIQAAVGHRAAVIELKPGLFLVADLPEAAARTEFGILPLLAPMMINAARRSMDNGGERRGPFAQLFRRRQREEPVRYVQVVQPVPAAPPALPAPADDTAVTVVAPNVGWADDATVAAAYGCDTCDRRRGR